MSGSFCPNFSLVVWKKTGDNLYTMVRLRCKSWQCEYCAAKNRALWRSHLKKRIGRIGGSWWFVTITAHERLRTQELSLENLRRGIDLLLKRLRRVYGRIDYVRVYEVHQKGAFHAHLIVQGLSARVAVLVSVSGNKEVYYRPAYGYVWQRTWGIRTWFRRAAREVGMGYMVDVQALETIPQVVNYVTKYMTKESQNFNVKGLRRIQASERIGAANPRGEGGWQVGPYVFGGEVRHSNLRDADLKVTITPDYWKEHVIYPEK